MRYISTRRGPDTPTRSFSDILLEGLAPDGGRRTVEDDEGRQVRLTRLVAALESA